MPIDVIRSKIVIAGLSYIQPVFQADYLQIRVIAEVTMPDVLNVDIVTPTDLVTLSTAKVLSDTTNGFVDSLVRTFSKPFADSTNETDVLRYVFGKKLADTQALADAKSISFGKALVDNTTPADLASLEPVKALADTLAASTDAVANVIYKVLSDSVTLTDFAQAFKLYIRTFDETLTAPDAYSETFDSGVTSDSAGASDNSFLEPVKNVTDGLNAIDDMDGNLNYAFVKVVGELLIGSDAQIIDFVTQKADNIAAGSSGVLSMQDYCDITYFLEDYVGLSRTFT